MSISEQEPPIDPMEKIEQLPNRAEFFVRRVFERIGAAIDFTLRRGGQPRTDMATLAAHLERAVEEQLRRDGSGFLAPNLFELRYDYETWMALGAERREFLERELSKNVYEYIYNRRYRISDPAQVRIGYDAFTRGLEVKAAFGAPIPAVMPQNEPQTLPAPRPASPARSLPAARCGILLRGVGTLIEARAEVASDAEPAGVGRNIANAIVIKDPTVSNFHAAFVLRPDGTLELADRGSANGTCVNGVMLEPAGKCIVRDGDRVRFGDVEAGLSIQ
ncbi:MAG: FhaA domain-containing protein [Blastocatellia bacterium]|nr:FhaA domain-containing protein [Blastocatellia bacterium]